MTRLQARAGSRTVAAASIRVVGCWVGRRWRASRAAPSSASVSSAASACCLCISARRRSRSAVRAACAAGSSAFLRIDTYFSPLGKCTTYCTHQGMGSEILTVSLQLHIAMERIPLTKSGFSLTTCPDLQIVLQACKVLHQSSGGAVPLFAGLCNLFFHPLDCPLQLDPFKEPYLQQEHIRAWSGAAAKTLHRGPEGTDGQRGTL